jgi:chemotaxis protein CheZ
MHNSARIDRLNELKRRYPASTTDTVVEVVDAILSTMHGDLSAPEAGLLAEIEDLARTIATAKAEIAALRVDDISTSHIPSATDELDAIVAHTAAATDSILEVCETLDDVAGILTRDGDPLGQASATKLQEATTRIYEACSFQDITGQRISKVVATLKAIDTKVATIMATFDGRMEPLDKPITGETMLLNGPQLPAMAMDQTDIDQLLASFD